MSLFSAAIRVSSFFGFNPGRLKKNVKGLRWFINDYKKLKKDLKGNKEFPFGKLYPVLTDRNDESGSASGHYFHQDLLTAQKIFYHNPVKHVDIGSRIDGFIAHVASFREIEMFDIRPLKNEIRNVKFVQANLIEPDPSLIGYTDSISSLHAIEHFGLGRYSDPIDAYGHIKALENIHSILKVGGRFYFSVPIGPQRIEFNAHRVFSLDYLLRLLRDKYIIQNFSYVDDSGVLHKDAVLTPGNIKSNFSCQFGCGIFELVKL
jgi:SAM-dependent methyltransferase